MDNYFYGIIGTSIYIIYIIKRLNNYLLLLPSASHTHIEFIGIYTHTLV